MLVSIQLSYLVAICKRISGLAD